MENLLALLALLVLIIPWSASTPSQSSSRGHLHRSIYQLGRRKVPTALRRVNLQPATPPILGSWLSSPPLLGSSLSWYCGVVWCGVVIDPRD